MDKLKEYGKIGIFTHLALSWTFFAGTYVVIKNSNKTDKIINYLKLQDKIPKSASSFMVSAVIYKAVMPVRIALSLLAIPLVISTFNIEIEQKK